MCIAKVDIQSAAMKEYTRPNVPTALELCDDASRMVVCIWKDQKAAYRTTASI